MQLNYSNVPAVGFPGMLADSSFHFIRSMSASETIPLGRVVAKAGTDGRCKLPASAAEVTNALGVATHSHHYAQRANGNTDILATETVNVTAQGTVWVLVEEAVVENDPVYVRHTVDGLLTQLGSVRKSAGTGATLLPGAKFLTSAASGGLAQLRVNIPA